MISGMSSMCLCTNSQYWHYPLLPISVWYIVWERRVSTKVMYKQSRCLHRSIISKVISNWISAITVLPTSSSLMRFEPSYRYCAVVYTFRIMISFCWEFMMVFCQQREWVSLLMLAVKAVLDEHLSDGREPVQMLAFNALTIGGNSLEKADI